ncbi:hypothetical protein BDN71DRAFT_1510820 [Pleurotus eryngii]|uniref:Uncharacterized protein n=1 Tax=Pleurotus eryngii TaxID=5323 RepID=A0A9P5ZP02_PLEER|nr:hypothetical protein BDN71DRAFT_1510820 [Pleurotus eryngii]
MSAIKIIEAACAQLSATVASLGHAVTNKAYKQPVCMHAALDAKITDHLLDKPKGLHTDELGRLSEQDPWKLGRILRTLATNHVYTKVVPNVFANNLLSMKFLSTDPVSSLVGHMLVWYWETFSKIPQHASRTEWKTAPSSVPTHFSVFNSMTV